MFRSDAEGWLIKLGSLVLHKFPGGFVLGIDGEDGYRHAIHWMWW